MVLLGFQQRSSVSQHDFFNHARLYFDIEELAVPRDTIETIQAAKEEGVLGETKAGLVELYRMVLKGCGTVRRCSWRPASKIELK